MKRKRGHKKGKSKKFPLPSPTSGTTAPESVNNDAESENTEEDSGSEEENDQMEEVSVSAPVPVPVPPPEKRETETVVNIRPPDVVFQRPPPTAVYGRVKVKLKTTPKPPPIESQSQGPIVSDAGNSTQLVSVMDKDKDKDKDKKEDGYVAVSEKVEDSSKKSTGIKIVSSKTPSPPGVKQSGVSGLSSEEEKNKKMEEQDAVLPPRPQVKYNKQELEASLEVIKKVMNMDAAEPFNVPVDPIQLGIPDYFDVIDTPMDFGTVRKNLETGTKYMDSEDVYNDVQYIWNNCYKYNNKGDYIVDLMKRVKKNFMKYWMAAGLYTEQTKKMIGGEGTPLDEPSTSSHGKKLKKGKGFKRHKDDCLCAICIMKRRRREREAREAQAALAAGGQSASPQIKHKTGLPEEYKQQESLHAESPVEETSSYMETSPDGDADAEMEDGEMRLDAVAPQYEQRSDIDRGEFRDKSDRSGDISEKSVQSDKGDTELYTHTEARLQDESGNRSKIDAQKQPLVQPEAQAAGCLHQTHELLELEKRRQKQRLLETFRDLENPMLLGLCGTLFPNNVQTVWNGANSLVRRQRSCHRRDIHEAVSSLLNPPCKSASSPK